MTSRASTSGPMRTRLALLGLLALSLPALGADAYQGTIAGNSSTSTSLAVTGGAGTLAVQCDAAAYVTVGDGSATASATAVKVAADALYDIPTGALRPVVAVLGVSGAANCKVYRVTVVRK